MELCVVSLALAVVEDVVSLESRALMDFVVQQVNLVVHSVALHLKNAMIMHVRILQQMDLLLIVTLVTNTARKVALITALSQTRKYRRILALLLEV